MFFVLQRCFLLCMLTLPAFLYGLPCLADDHVFKKPVLLMAQQVEHDKEQGIVWARGEVEIEHEGRVLQADKVQYNEKTDQAIAQGNVRLFEPSGEIIFMEEAHLSGDLKNGFVRHLKMLLSDASRLSGSVVKLARGHQSTFDYALYSPCKVCRKKPSRPPLWQIKARRVTWDEASEDIIYTDATMEFAGVPVLYTPYLRHPAPTVKRRSGFLAPFFGGSASYGTLLGMPYYWVIDENKDATITPMMVGSRPMLGLEYRQLFTKGKLDLNGSMTNASRTSGSGKNTKNEGNGFRGHILGNGLMELDENWRAGFRLERATDQTYLKKYGHLGLSSKNVLVTKGYIEGFWGRSYATAEAYTFQGLREVDSNATTPVILPKADFNYLGQPGRWGGVWTFHGSALALSRREGNDMQRLSADGGWYVPYYSSWGHVMTSGFKVRSDYYHVTDYRLPASGSVFEGNVGRLYGQAYSMVDWPFVQVNDGTRFILEPRAGLVVSPNTGHSQKIPNEDSRIIELNDLNMMSESRFAGLDRIDGGSRINYGLNLAAYTANFGNADAFIGQSIAFSQPREYLRDTGMDNKISDYVARLRFSYTDWLTIRLHNLMNRKSLHSKRTEFSTLIGKPVLRVGVDYILLPRITSDPLDKKGEQIRLTLSSRFTDFWSARIGTTRELGKGGGMLSQDAGFLYEDECFTFDATVQKTYYHDRDMHPGVTVMFRFIFKNLGEFQQGTKLSH